MVNPEDEMLVEVVWPDDKVSIVAISGQWERLESGGVRCIYTREQLGQVVTLMQQMGLDGMKPETVLSVRTTTWLIRFPKEDYLLVKDDRCTIIDVYNEISEQTDETFFIYPIVVGRFRVEQTQDGFMIAPDRRIVNQDGRVVIDPDVEVTEVEPLKPKIKEGF